jgi:PIN domain nuclease of toxin-antitoxin system
VKLLLDTCTFLWIALGDKALSSEARKLFLDEDNDCFLSAVSAWEIGMKHSLGRLPLPTLPGRFVPEQRQAHGIDPLPVEEIAALQLPALPSIHRDPFDRMLVCQAVAHGLVLLTPDEQIARYPVRTIW